jgi:hypothetical protein
MMSYDKINKIKKSIFIVGMPRSGTTLIQSILSTNDEVYTLPETHILNKARRVFKRKIRIHDILISNINVWIQLSKLNLPKFIFKDKVSLIKKLHLSLSKKTSFNQKYYIEKTPSHLSYVPYLRKYIEDVKFIFVVRNITNNLKSFDKLTKTWNKDEISSSRTEQEIRWISENYKVFDYYKFGDSIIINYDELTNVKKSKKIILDLEKFIGFTVKPDQYNMTVASKKIINKDEFWKNNNLKNGIIFKEKTNINDQETHKLVKNLDKILKLNIPIKTIP